jgi:hypothetical protein
MTLAFAPRLLQDPPVPQDYGAAAGLGMGILLGILAVFIICVAGAWKMFAKAGQPGWTALVPIYNLLVLAQVAGKPMWWGLLLLIPFVGFVIWIIMALELARRFGKDVLFVIGLVFLAPIFVCILGFGSATYSGPRGQSV